MFGPVALWQVPENQRARGGDLNALSRGVTNRKSKSLSISVLLHAAVLALLVAIHSQVLRQPDPIVPGKAPVKLVFTPRRVLPPVTLGREHVGGANAATAPPRRGEPPPKLVKIFLPPETRPEPKLSMPLAVDFEPPTPSLMASVIGDPFGSAGGTSLGTGGVGGIGIGGCCGSMGEGRGLKGGGQAGGRISPPQLIYKVEPEFSEEARKAKFQGTVVLSVQVDASGKPSHLVVVSSPGLGLDEKAVDAVARWLFRPAYRDGKPFVTTARVEVSFHLL